MENNGATGRVSNGRTPDCGRKITVSRGEINNKPGQIYLYKSGDRLTCRSASPPFQASGNLLVPRLASGIEEEWNLYRQPLSRRVSYRKISKTRKDRDPPACAALPPELRRSIEQTRTRRSRGRERETRLDLFLQRVNSTS